MTTKTSLTEFLEILAHAKCIISVDTGSVHMAAAVHCPVYAIFNGSQYGRFAPYPKELNKKFYSVYPDIVEKEIMEAPILPLKYVYHSGVSYNAVPAKKLITLIKRTLRANQI
jgi:ADP-heptose:LPS heptosyltransferase